MPDRWQMPEPAALDGVRVAHVTTVHTPFDTRIFHKECRSLVEAGLEVFLVVSRDEEAEDVDGVHVVPLGRAPRGKVARMLRQPWRALRVVRSLRPDVVHLHDPELLVLAPLLQRRSAVIWDSHEDLPAQVRGKEWIPGAIRRLVAGLITVVERVLVHWVDSVVSAEPAGAARFRARPVHLVQNFPLERELTRPLTPWRHRTGGPLYLGSITRSRGAVEMAEAMAFVATPVTLDLAGPVSSAGLMEELEGLARTSRVRLHGKVERPKAMELLGEARVGLVLLQPTDQYASATQPVKLFEYLAAGVPFVCSDFPAVRALVGEEAGCFVDPTDRRAIAAAIDAILEDVVRAEEMSTRGRRLALERFSWDGELPKLLEAYRSALARQS
jgi:glycosyltransferase involved in cell wall biosynthesis